MVPLAQKQSQTFRNAHKVGRLDLGGEREKVTFSLLPNNQGFLIRWKRQLLPGVLEKKVPAQDGLCPPVSCAVGS